MKKYYTLLLLIFTIVGKAQIVNIPDPEFKFRLLLEESGVNTNHDNEIQVSEAVATTQLNIQDGFVITNLSGLEAFSNLTSLILNHMYSLTAINVSSLTALETLSIDEAPITTINVSMLTNLTNFRIARSNISTLNLSGFPHLRVLDVYQNNLLTSLTLSSLPGLEDLYTNECSALGNFDITGLANLKKISCVYNSAITSLNLTDLSHLKIVNCSNCLNLSDIITTGATAITELYCSYCKLASINVSAMLLLEKLDCSNNYGNGPGITTLNVTGLTNLTDLNCSANRLANLEVSTLINLKNLDCYFNLLTTLNVAPITNLISLNFQGNHITAINLAPLVNLKRLVSCENPLPAIDVSSLVNLETFYCWDNGFSALNLTNLTKLRELYCMNNHLTTLDLSHQTKLERFNCGRNLLESVDLSTNENFSTPQGGGISFNYFFDFTDSPNLKYINLKFGALYNLNLASMSFNGCPNLLYICAEEPLMPYIAASLEINQISNVEINSYCNFIPGGIYNSITGTQTFDSNNNGCDANELHPPVLKININDGTDTGTTFSDVNGQYKFYTNTGSFVLTPVFENQFFTVSPSSATVNFATLDGSTQIQDFCITPIGTHYDVEITLIPVRPARPGFDTDYKLVYKNIGNQILSGNINLSFDDDLIDFVISNPATSNQSPFLLTWDYANLYPFESREIYVVFNVNSPQEVPPVNNGSILHYQATILINGQDETPESNTFNLNQTVVGSFDPNDKTCLEGNTITPEMVGGYLHYLIRFQNSGTAAAENIVVKDVIDTTKFDISSLQLTGSSHPQVTKITGNKVEFQFQNINLPAEINDEPGSHGYVAFKIKTKGNLVIGDSVANKADIYFDYNFPIETNTATSTVALLGVNQVENQSVSITPNPTKNKITVTSKGAITSVQLFDVQGRILETMTVNSEQVDFDLSQKTTGVYFVKIITNKGIKTEKIIKE